MSIKANLNLNKNYLKMIIYLKIKFQIKVQNKFKKANDNKNQKFKNLEKFLKKKILINLFIMDNLINHFLFQHLIKNQAIIIFQINMLVMRNLSLSKFCKEIFILNNSYPILYN